MCDSALHQIVQGPTIVSGLSSGLVPVGQLYRLQNLVHTSGNLKFVISAAGEQRNDFEKAFVGIDDQFAAVELVLNRRSRGESVPHLTTYDLLLGLTASALHVTGNLPYVPELATDAEGVPNDLLFRVHRSQSAVLKALTRNNVLPLVLIKPENVFAMMAWMFPSTKGLFPGIVDEAGSLNLDAIPAVLPTGATSASRMTATVLLTLAKQCQDAATRGSLLPGAPVSGEGSNLAIRASFTAALLMYYCALALCPSASVCNNLGILLSTLAGAQVVCLTHPPGTHSSGPTTSEVLTGPGLAQAYYLQGLSLDPHHPHLLTNMGSLLKEEGKINEAIK